MIRVSITQAKAQLSKYLKKVEQGQTVVLTRRNRPIANIRPIPPRKRRPRPIGLCAGEFVVPPDFDAPLPKDLLNAFDRKG